MAAVEFRLVSTPLSCRLSRSRVSGIGFVLLESFGLPACLPLSVLDTVSPPILMIPQSLSLFVCLCLSLCHHLCAYASLSLTVSILSPLLFLRALPPDSPFLLVAHSTSARLDPLTLALDDHRSTGSRVDLCVPKKSSRLFNI